MRTWGVTLAALLGAGTIAVLTPVGVAAASSKTVKVKGPSFRVPFPSAGQTQITLETIKVTVPKGAEVKSLTVRSANVGQLPPATGITAAVAPKSSSGRTVTFKIYVFMENYSRAAADKRARPAVETQSFDEIETDGVVEDLSRMVAQRSERPAFTAFDKGLQDCALAWAAGFYGDGIWSSSAYSSLQSSAFSSPPEGQIDNMVYNACKDQPEGSQHETPEPLQGDSGND